LTSFADDKTLTHHLQDSEVLINVKTPCATVSESSNTTSDQAASATASWQISSCEFQQGGTH